MLTKIDLLFSMLRSTSAKETLTPRFWALVKETEGNTALLEAKGKLLQVTLQTTVHKGEKLLLEKRPVNNQQLECRVLQRIATNDQGNSIASVVFYPDHNEDYPYLLTVEEQPQAKSNHNASSTWRFSMYTETLGTVVLIIKQGQEHLTAQLLVEDEKVQRQLAEVPQYFPPDNNLGLRFQGIRVMTSAEREQVMGAGISLNQIG